MAMSKRVRYEVLKRDNYTCRYCGAKPPEAVITVDHVTPVALGGTDDPENLVAACRDCNYGKASTAPADPLVADVRQADLRWARAMKDAAAVQAAKRDLLIAYVDRFYEEWCQLTMSRLPSNFESSIESLYVAGLPEDEMLDSVHIACTARGVESRFRYFCGVAWRKMREIQEVARALYEAEEVE